MGDTMESTSLEARYIVRKPDIMISSSTYMVKLVKNGLNEWSTAGWYKYRYGLQLCFDWCYTKWLMWKLWLNPYKRYALQDQSESITWRAVEYCIPRDLHTLSLNKVYIPVCSWATQPLYKYSCGTFPHKFNWVYERIFESAGKALSFKLK